MNIFKSKIKALRTDREVDSVSIWRVSWNRYKPYCYNDAEAEVVYRAFTEEEDAKDFCSSLKQAQKLLQNSSGLNIEIVKMEE